MAPEFSNTAKPALVEVIHVSQDDVIRHPFWSRHPQSRRIRQMLDQPDQFEVHFISTPIPETPI